MDIAHLKFKPFIPSVAGYLKYLIFNSDTISKVKKLQNHHAGNWYSDNV